MDANILLWIQDNLRIKGLNSFMISITHLGDIGIFWLVLVIVFLFHNKTRRLAYTMIFGLLAGLLVNNIILKNLFARMRPYDAISSLHLMIPRENDFSFPSAHAGVFFAMAMIIAKFTPKQYGIFAFVLAVLVAFSRLYVGVHYPTDVLCGCIDGALIGWGIAKLDLFHVKENI